MKTVTSEEWTALREDFDPEQLKWVCVQKSVGAKGQAMWGAYVPAETIRRRLDNVVDVDGWSFEIADTQSDDIGNGEKLVTVFGRLRLADVVREDAGSDVVAYRTKDGEVRTDDNGWKSAVSRSLTRCAAAFGIGSECKEIPFAFTDSPKDKPPYHPGHKSKESKPAKTTGGKATVKQMDALKKVMGGLRAAMGERQADAWMKDLAKAKSLNLGALTNSQAAKVIKAVQTKIGETT